MHDRIAHTAEHAFVGSLQHILGQTLQVRKVEHKGGANTAFIVIPDLDIKTALEAQAQVNALIGEGCRVSERVFESLEAAYAAVPGLRANEERISGEVRVVEIESHDAAACAMEHAANLNDCDLFLVTRLSKSGQEYEVEFAVGTHAMKMAQSLAARLLNVCGELGANLNTVENTIRKLKSDYALSRGKLWALGSGILAGIAPQKIGDIVMIKAVHSNLDDEQLVEFAGERISSGKNIVVLLSNQGPDAARIVLARSDDLIELDCNSVFKKIVGTDGRGGGRENFVTGSVSKTALVRIMDGLSSEVSMLAKSQGV